MKCKHNIKTEHCSICTPHKSTQFEPYTVTFEDGDGKKVRMRKTRKVTKYKTPKETQMEELTRKSYWGYQDSMWD
jgi:hypothetical protein